MTDQVRYFFDLPVYRLAENKYQEALEHYVQERLDRAGGAARNADVQLSIREHARQSYGGPWRYNEIIGYVRLHFLGSQVRGEYFTSLAKRVVRTRRKIFWRTTHKLAAEVNIPKDASSSVVFVAICDYVERCRQHLTGRVIDATVLMALGRFVDWHDFYESTRSQDADNRGELDAGAAYQDRSNRGAG